MQQQEEQNLGMQIDAGDHVIRSASNNQVLEFSPPKQNDDNLRRGSPAKTPTRQRRKAVQKFYDGLKTNKSFK